MDLPLNAAFFQDAEGMLAEANGPP